MILNLSEAEIAPLLDYGELIPAMETALAEFSSGRAIQPVRNIMTVEEGARYLGDMPAITEAGMGAKLVSYYPANAGTEFPIHQAMIMLFDPISGAPLACLDGGLITEMRTAAVSAAATRHLASEKASVLAIIGSGVQARSHLQALRHLYQFDEVRVWSRNPEHAAAFAAAHGVRTMALQEAVLGADIVVTATGSREPLVKGAWLTEGAHVNAVGAPLPTWRELDDAAMDNTLIVDSRDAVVKESGDVILSGAPIFAEVGEIFSGDCTPPRSSTTIFKSVGLAVEDIAAARLVYDKAIAMNGP